MKQWNVNWEVRQVRQTAHELRPAEDAASHRGAFLLPGDDRVRPQREHRLQLFELRLQGGARVHRGLHFPLHAIQRPERNLR